MAVCELIDYECPDCGHAFPVVPGSAERCAQCGRPVSAPQPSGSQPPPAREGSAPRAREA